MSVIADSALALSWCFEDERTPATKILLERVGETGARGRGIGRWNCSTG